MTHLDRIVSRVILLAKLPGNKRRCEVEKELRTYLDDLAAEARFQGYDDEATARIARMRFGDPEEVAAAFASVYAPERLARRILHSALLVTASTVAVIVVIVTVQSMAAICTASSIVSTLRDIHRELFGFGAIVAGYCSRVRWGAPFSDVSGEGAFAKHHCGSMAGRGFRLADPTACGTAIGCLYVCRIRSPASARRDTLRLVRRNGAAAANGMGMVRATHFRLAVPVVGVVRVNNLLQSTARSCSAL